MTVLVLLAVLALVVVGLAVLVVALVAARRDRPAVRPAREPVPADLEGLRGEVAALRAEGAQALRHLGLVRYDAFGDMGGHLSWSLALLDDTGDGVLLTAINGRSEARSYAKSIARWTCGQPVSPEEEEAIAAARE